jgi:hypothetical protein
LNSPRLRPPTLQQPKKTSPCAMIPKQSGTPPALISENAAPVNHPVLILFLRLLVVAGHISPATRQSRVAQRAQGLALDGRGSGRHGFTASADARSLFCSRPIISYGVRLVCSPPTDTRLWKRFNRSATSDTGPFSQPRPCGLGSRSRRTHIYALKSCMRVSRRRVAIKLRVSKTHECIALTPSWTRRDWCLGS